MPRTEGMPKIRLDSKSLKPIHLQLQEGLENAIKGGTLQPQLRLPSVHVVARNYHISTGTVMRAFSELARKGLLEARRGRGTYVAARRICTTEVLLPSWLESEIALSSRGLLDQIMRGLREGFGEGERRFCLDCTEGKAPTAQEILDVCRARSADSVIIVGAERAATAGLEQVVREFAVVALQSRRTQAEMDSVDIDPARALEAMLARRLQAGARQFAFAGPASCLQACGVQSAYGRLLEIFRATLAGAGVEPHIHVLQGESRDDLQAKTAALADVIPPGSVFLAATPAVVDLVDPDGTRCDTLTFTESRLSLDRLRGRVSVIYAGMEISAACGARLLSERLRTGLASPVQHVMLEAEVHEADVSVS